MTTMTAIAALAVTITAALVIRARRGRPVARVSESRLGHIARHAAAARGEEVAAS